MTPLTHMVNARRMVGVAGVPAMGLLTPITRASRSHADAAIFLPIWRECDGYKTPRGKKSALLVKVSSSRHQVGRLSPSDGVSHANTRGAFVTPDLFPDALTIADINTTLNHEPRIYDLRLAQMLGFSEPRNIRALVTRNKDALERLGEFCCTVQRNPMETGKRGRPSVGYWFNKRQALYLCTKSDSANATEVTIKMVEVFDAVTAGRLPSPRGGEGGGQRPPGEGAARRVAKREPRPALPAPDPGPQSLSVPEALALLDPPYRWMSNVSVSARTLPLIRALIVILRARLRHAELAASAVRCAVGDPDDIRATTNDIGR